MSEILSNYTYTLDEINNILFQGFDYKIPEATMEHISILSMQVGAPDYVKTPVFQKRENPMKTESHNTGINSNNGHSFSPTGSREQNLYGNNRRRGNRTVNVNDDDWNAIRTFQATKMDLNKTGSDAEFDMIRTLTNKLSDKNYCEIRDKIIELVNKINVSNTETDLSEISANIFDIASSNRYYSKLYADLYADLSDKFEFIKSACDENFTRFTELFNNIEYVDSNENYDKFCEINKINEKRKSLAAFYLNLMIRGVITEYKIVEITHNLLSKIHEYISIDNKKNEVDELTETISILYKNSLFQGKNASSSYEKIDGLSIYEVVKKIAGSDIKTYKSLTNKSLFKFMDLMEA